MQAVLWWNCWVTVLECVRAPDLCVPDWKWLTARAALGTLTHGAEEAGRETPLERGMMAEIEKEQVWYRSKTGISDELFGF